MNKKLEYAYDKMNRCCVSAQSMFSIAGFDMEYEEWFEIMLDSFEEGKDYTTVVVPARPILTPNKKYTFDHLLPLETYYELLPIHIATMIKSRIADLTQESESKSSQPQDNTGEGGALGKEKTYADIVSEQTEPLTITRIAKDFGLSAIRLNELLESLKIQYRVYGTWRLESDYLDKDLVVYETHGYHDHEGNHQEAYRMKWTQKGRLFIYEQLKKASILPLCETKKENKSYV